MNLPAGRKRWALLAVPVIAAVAVLGVVIWRDDIMSTTLDP